MRIIFAKMQTADNVRRQRRAHQLGECVRGLCVCACVCWCFLHSSTLLSTKFIMCVRVDVRMRVRFRARLCGPAVAVDHP